MTDWVIVNAQLISQAAENRPLPRTAIAIEGDRILAVGSDDEIGRWVGEQTQIMNLQGRAVIPGFVDSHVHFVQTGLSLQGPDLSSCQTVEEVLQIVRQAIRCHEPGKPLFFHRCFLDELDRPLTSADLDRVATKNPVAIGDFELHAVVVNQLAFEAIDLPPQTAGIIRDRGESGSVTGKLIELAHKQARGFFYDAIDDAAYRDAVQKACRVALQAGVTTVHAIEGRESFGTQHLSLIAASRSMLPIRLVLYYQGTSIDEAVRVGVQGIADLWADGAYMDRSAALMEPYTDDPVTCGSLLYTQEEMNKLVWRAHCLGLQVSFHAVGDAAIEQVLNAYEAANARDASFKEMRPRIEHFSLPTPEQIGRALELGVALAMQPVMSAGPQTTVLQRLGHEREARRHPYRKLVDAGLLVSGGSDSDVTPIDPLAGIRTLVRQPVTGRRLNMQEALALFTINGARIAGEERDKGSIEPGKLADLVVLNRDPLTMESQDLNDLQVDMTIVGGRIMWSRPAAVAESGILSKGSINVC